MAQVRHPQPGSGIAGRHRALQMTHDSLEEKLAAELHRPLPDMALLQRLRRRKLLVKDELAGIERLLHAIRAESPVRAAG